MVEVCPCQEYVPFPVLPIEAGGVIVVSVLVRALSLLIRTVPIEGVADIALHLEKGCLVSTSDVNIVSLRIGNVVHTAYET